MNFDENEFIEKAKPQILRGRDGDWNHAKRVVDWVKKLGERREELYLLITAGYIHDIGWRDVLPPQKLSLVKLRKFEVIANKNSGPFIKEFLNTLGFSTDEIEKVVKLVRAADKYESTNEEEVIIVDSDNLSKLDIDHLKEKYLKKEWMKMYEFWNEKIPMRVKSDNGKRYYPNLLKELKKDIELEFGYK